MGQATVVLIYGGIQLVAQGVLGDALAAATAAPLADAARQLVGPVGSSVMLAAAGLSMFVVVFGDLLGCPRTLFRLASDGQLPSALARIHPSYRTPATAIVVYASLVFVLAMSSRFDVLASAASAAVLLVYAAVAVAVIALRRRNVVSELPPFVIAGGWTIPVLALGASVWLLAYTPRPQAIGLAVLTLGIAAIYGIMVLVRTTRAGVVDPGVEGAEP